MSLIAWYKLDGNALDSSGNGNHGATVGTPNVVAGKIGSSYSFDYSSDDGISIPNNNFPLYDFTMTAWIKPVGNHYHYDGTIISSGNWNSSHWSFGIRQGNDGFSCRNPGISVASAPYTFSLNTWHFVVYRREGTNLKLYANNTLVYNGTVTTHIPLSSDATNTCIGRETYAGGYFGFNGSIDDVRIYDHALSEKEIKELAKAKILHYTFDEFQEPTENLLYDNGTINWTISNLTGTFTRTTVEENVRYRITSGASSSSFRFSVPITKLTNGATYTLSYNYSIVQGTTFSMSDWCDTTLFNRVDTAGYSSASGTRATYDSTFRFMDFSMSANSVVEIWNVQLEEKDHATPFVNGTRTGSVSDNSGYDNHADLALATTPQWVEDSRIGKGAYKFNNSYIETSTFYLPSKKDWTVSCWIKTTSGGTIISNRSGGPVYNRLQVSDGKISYHYYNNTWLTTVGNTLVNDNVWHLLSWVNYNNQTMDMYIDGVKDLSTFSAPLSGSDIGPVDIIGKDWSSGYFNGSMDDVRIYATALSADDIKELYQTRASIDNKGNFFANNIEEPANIASIVNEAIVNKTFTNGVSSYTQANCQVSLTDNGYRIYRPANLIHPDAGNTMWGGLRINLFNNEESKIEKGKRYRISFLVNGKTSNSPGGVSFSNNMGWGGGGLTNVGFSYNDTIPTDFNGVKRVVAETNVIDDIYKVCTTSYSSFVAGQYYNCYRDLCFGFSYQSTGTLGTDIYITDFKVQEITDNNKNNIGENGIAKMFEISELGPTNGLVAYYPLNGDAKDYANANDGTVNGAIVSAGINGKACYSFDGVDDYINCGNSIPSTLGQTFSASLWVKTFSRGERWEDFLVSGTSYGGASTLHIGFTDKSYGYYFFFEVRANGNRKSIYFSADGYSEDDWHLLTMTADPQEFCVYINGVKKESSLMTGVYTPLNDNLIIGGNRYMNGLIQNVRIYNRALSAEEIKILYDLEGDSNIKAKMDKNTIYLDGELYETL